MNSASVFGLPAANLLKYVNLAWIAALLCTAAVTAQLTTGDISGKISDASGAVVPGVEVTVRNTQTGLMRPLITNDAGRYQAPNLPLGEYEVRAELSGFQTTVRTGINLTVGRNAVVDLTLQVGEVTEIVTVSGEAALLETTTATVSNLVDEKKVQDLPLNNRDLTQLSFLQPGVLKVPQNGEQGVFSGMGDKMTVSGARGTQNLYLLDGVSNADLSGNAQGSSSAYIGAETVKEFQIVTNNYSAEYKSAAGGIVSAVTKSGANSFNGSLFLFHRNDNLDAANFFDNSFGNPKPEFKRNQFGGSLGGPIARSRAFFFGSYEGLRERLGTTDTARVPTAAARDGILPSRRVTVAPSIRPYLALYPVPGQNNAIVEDFRDGTVLIAGTLRQPTREDFFTAKIDHQFSTSQAFSGTYSFDNGERSPFGLRGDVGGGADAFGTLGTDSVKHVVSLRHSLIVSGSTLNEFNLGYSFSRPRGDIPLTKRNFGNLVFHPERKLMGQIDGTDFSDIGFRTGSSSYAQKGWTLKDSLSLTRGYHSMRAGAEINLYYYHQASCSRGCNGIYEFRTLEALLTGAPRRFEVMLPGGDDPKRNLRQILFGSYLQDNYALGRSLTLNLGLRYEFATVPKERDGKVSNLLNFTDTAVTVGKFYTNATLKSFSPRFGFAWAPASRKTSVRGGFGIFYEHPMLYNIRTALQELPPFTLVGRLDSTSSRPVIFPDAFSTQLNLISGRPNIRHMEYNQKNAYIYRWSLTLQREFGTDWIVSTGYTGSRALHLWQQSLPNIRRWAGFPSQAEGRKFWPAGSPFISPQFGEIRTQYPNANSYHHGLAVGLQRRLKAGLTLQASYNYSKSIDQGSGVTSGGDQLPQEQRGIYAWDLHLKKGLSSFDIRNNFAANFSYELALGKSLTGVAGLLAKGWQLNGILSLSDGYPLSVLDESNPQADRIGDDEELRVNLIPGGNKNPVRGGPDRYYDTSQFTPSEIGYFGTLGRNTVISPGLAALDLSIFKNFEVGEEGRVQFRAEFFNLLNRANFGTPDMTPFTVTGTPDSNAGRIERTRTAARQVQFGLKYLF